MKKNEQITVEQDYNVDVETVWKAITRTDLMRQWFFDNIPEFQPMVGFKTEFDVKSQDRIFRHMWEVTEVVPLNKLVYNWRYEGYQGDSYVEFELTPDEYRTTLTLRHNVTEDFPEDVPEFTRESCRGGWEYFIKKRLREYLKKESK